MESKRVAYANALFMPLPIVKRLFDFLQKPNECSKYANRNIVFCIPYGVSVIAIGYLE